VPAVSEEHLHLRGTGIVLLERQGRGCGPSPGRPTRLNAPDAVRARSPEPIAPWELRAVCASVLGAADSVRLVHPGEFGGRYVCELFVSLADSSAL